MIPFKRVTRRRRLLRGGAALEVFPDLVMKGGSSEAVPAASFERGDKADWWSLRIGPNEEGTLLSVFAQLEAEIGWLEQRPPVD